MNTPLKVDPEFERIIPALTDDEFKQLEANILAEGEIFTPIFVWNGFRILPRFLFIISHFCAAFIIFSRVYIKEAPIIDASFAFFVMCFLSIRGKSVLEYG